MNTSDPAFAGEALRADGKIVDLWVTDTSEEVVDRVISGQPRSAFDVHVASFSYQSLLGAEQDVIEHTDADRKLGFEATHGFPDVHSNRLVLRVTGDLAAAKAVLTERYGAEVTVEGATDADVLVQDADRANDVTPYSGGDFFYTVNGGFAYNCTTGPGIHIASTGNDYALTDAHCTGTSTTGQTVKNAYYHGGANGSDATMGTVSHTKWPSTTSPPSSAVSYFDTALLSLSSVDSTDWAAGGILKGQSGYATKASQVGLHFCADGAFEGEVCPTTATVDTQDNYFTDARGNKVVGLTQTTAAGGVVSGGGDSGGPVWHLPSDSSETIFGVIEGHVASSSTACVVYTYRGNDCGKALLYTDMSALLTTWVATVKT